MSLLVGAGTGKEMSAEDADRRFSPRSKTLKRAKVYFNHMNSTFDCLVRNVSATGALLALDESAHLPREFDVRIGDDKVLRPARLVYRRGSLAGIHFADTAEADDPSTAQISADELRAVLGEQSGDHRTIRRLRGERLPSTVTHNFRWY